MTYQTDVAAAVNDLYTAFGVAATFTDLAGDETCATVIVVHDLTPYGPDVASATVRSVAISARKSDVAYSPRSGESYTVGDTTYIVDSVIAEDEVEHTVLAS